MVEGWEQVRLGCECKLSSAALGRRGGMKDSQKMERSERSGAVLCCVRSKASPRDSMTSSRLVSPLLPANLSPPPPIHNLIPASPHTKPSNASLHRQ